MSEDDDLTRAEEAELARRAGVGPGQDDPWGESVVSPLADGDERLIEGALRPKRLDDFVGQARVREQLTLLLHSALRRGRPPDQDRKSTRLNSSHLPTSRMPSSA